MIITPATLDDIVALYRGLGIETPRREEWRAIRFQVAEGRSWAYRLADRDPPMALAGIVRTDDVTAWFRSGAGLERHMLVCIRHFRGWLCEQQQSAARPIVTWQQAANPTGQRIARALGFCDTGRRSGAVEIWEFGADGSGDRKFRRAGDFLIHGEETEAGRAAPG